MADGLVAHQAAMRLRQQHGMLLSTIDRTALDPAPSTEHGISHLAAQRSQATADLVLSTFANDDAAADRAVTLMAEWIDQRALVRILSFGNGATAVGVPAHHLAQAGARVVIEGGMLPATDPVHGGGLVAVIADGDCDSAADMLYDYRRANRDLKIVGVGPANIVAVAECCDAFLGWPPEDAAFPVNGHGIAQILDTVVVQAVRALGRMRWPAYG